MGILQIIILSVIQGLAELLPVSSSAHVILAQHLMGLNPASPEMTFFLVMLHTGTMFAVLAYFGRRWIKRCTDVRESRGFIRALIIATIVTGLLGFGLKIFIEKIILEHILGYAKGEVESLFAMLPLMAFALFVSGLLIIASGRRSQKARSAEVGDKRLQRIDQSTDQRTELSDRDSVAIGFIQGLCLPFRGLSRSGSTISVGLFRDLSRVTAEEFSFALAILLTPPAIALELRRLLKSSVSDATPLSELLSHLLAPGLLGMVFSFMAGLLALRWLSTWLEKGRWSYFGYYCLAFSVVVLVVHFQIH